MSSNNPHEESERFFKKYQKENRQERKQKQALDRSKYKKTDLSKHQKKHLTEEGDESLAKLGLIVRIVSRGFIVDCEGKEFLSSIRGSLKEQSHEDKNLVTIGDYVRFIPQEDGTGWVTSILPRKSALSRKDNLLREKRQFIAANVDQVLICASIIDPPLKPTLIDRYIIAAIKGNITPIVVINKCDLIEDNEAEKEILQEVVEAYRAASIPVVAVSAANMEGLNELKALMAGKISVLSGQSGVGKSSLINALMGTDLAVGKTTRERKGSHTTTHPILLPMKPSGYCIDTPGIKSFSIWAISNEPLDSYFPEIFQYKDQCHFRDCSHTHEEGCEVIKMVEEGRISPLRYHSYTSLIQEDDNKRR